MNSERSTLENSPPRLTGITRVSSIESILRVPSHSSQQSPKWPAVHDTSSSPHLRRASSVSETLRGWVGVGSSSRSLRDAAQDADKKNAEQARRVGQAGTIWHAVKHADLPGGQDSFKLATGTSHPWQEGKSRGPLGETPLHLAVLYNSSADHDDIVDFLWDTYPALRTCQYDLSKDDDATPTKGVPDSVYHGENVLHIAIVRKDTLRQFPMIQKFVESAEGPELLLQRATGAFFSVGSVGCCCYGEYPLAFAACTNQLDVFDYLVTKGALLTQQTTEGNNLLHLLVLQSIPPETSEDGEGGGMSDAETCQWCCTAYDHVQMVMKQEGVYEEMMLQRNNDNHTPLTLCTANGSLDMFNHLFAKLMQVEWSFGPISCKKLYLLEVDFALESEVDSATPLRSVLEVAVASARNDILTEGHLSRILDNKWDKYAEKVYQDRFWSGLALVLMQVLVIATDPGGMALMILVLCVCEAAICIMYLRDFVRETKRINSGSGFPNMLFWQTASDFERLLPLISLPVYLTILILRWNKPCAASGDIVSLVYCRYSPARVPCALEAALLVVQSLISFGLILVHTMGFPEYGHFMIMLLKMVQNDVRKLSSIYLIVLAGFSQMLYIASNLQNTGILTFCGWIQISLKAALQQVDFTSGSGTSETRGGSVVVTALLTTNFLLVSLVMINLLIAMMSSTYDSINESAKAQWNLVRARIILHVDKELTQEERTHESRKYWEDAGGKDAKARVMTFTTSSRNNHVS